MVFKKILGKDIRKKNERNQKNKSKKKLNFSLIYFFESAFYF
jgi:hypothetical protein